MTGASGAVLPTGEQLGISHGDQSATVTEVGATLRSYTVAGFETLDTFGPDEMSDASRGQVLLPFPNRVAGGLYEFRGQANQLPINEPAANNALHGLTRFLPWETVSRTLSRVVMAQRVYPQEGYPYALALRVEYDLSAEGLTVTTIATNKGAGPLPFGAGYHPYLTVGTPTIDAATLRLPARTYLRTDERSIPTGRAGVEGTAFDFRDARPIGGVEVDACFTDVVPDPDGYARVVMTHPQGRPEITVGMDASYGFVQVYTGDILPREDRRRGLAVEPMTCAPNAFNSGDGLRVLDPGESFTGAWTISCA